MIKTKVSILTLQHVKYESGWDPFFTRLSYKKWDIWLIDPYLKWPIACNILVDCDTHCCIPTYSHVFFYLAGVIAHKMGLPVKLVCTVNVNDIVARTMKDGDYSMADKVVPTLASAMDIQVTHYFTLCRLGTQYV